ncbi:hypothetical protein KC865_04970 [Candidatus Kaiserbacteria bacterium]|nr:hypothetical protein [Candidatus Kaiserbacteria bacterium]USN92239.1 MAG: hypothetical protein H6782_00220 [Candidatus Nomurabacteria bacterium]
MKSEIKRMISGATAFLMLAFLPNSALAQFADTGDGGEFQELLLNLMVFINNVLIPFIIGIGFLFFVWGMFLFFILGGADEEKKEKGKSLMIYAVIGFVVIIIFFGVVNLITSSTGLDGEILRNVPTVPVPRP